MSNSTKVIINTYAKHDYHDTDYIALVYDRNTRKIDRVTYGTTRGHMTCNLLEGMNDKPSTADYLGAAKCLVKEWYQKDDPQIGDTVIITKGRKYPKGTTFKLDHTSSYRDRYNRVQTIYACSEDNKIKTNIKNCSLHKLGFSSALRELTQ